MHRLRRAHPAVPAMHVSAARAERATPDAIRLLQERRLRLLVRIVAARSPFYRRWFVESGVNPASIRGLEDLDRLPLLDRSAIMTNPSDFAVYPTRVMWPSRSSGTSGRAVTVYRTPGASAFEMVALRRQWGWFGLPRDARRVILRGDFTTGEPGTLAKPVPGNRQLLVSSYHLTAEALPEILAAVRAFRPHAVEGWPSSVALLAARMRDCGEQLPVQAVITSSEVMTGAQRGLIRDVFSGPIVDHYGQTERVIMAGDCERGGYHLFPDYGITEFLPVAGSSDRHELVGTALRNWGFPLLRYRTGDEAGPAEDGPCPCGRAFPLLGRIDGRTEDMFVAADGRLIPLPASVIDSLTDLAEAQIAQLDRGRFAVRVVPASGFDAEANRVSVLHNVEKYIGPGQEVIIETMDRIPRPPSGKLKSAVVEGGPVRVLPVVGP